MITEYNKAIQRKVVVQRGKKIKVNSLNPHHRAFFKEKKLFIFQFDSGKINPPGLDRFPFPWRERVRVRGKNSF
jgi:hypothetical protein